jgi:hypothetical protein
MHGHYIAMGRLAIDTSEAPDIFPLGITGRRILTWEGVLLLDRINPQIIPDISKLEILDKSKASDLAKTPVCLQAFWFCMQVLVRVASHLTISILELNTFAHALCTLLIYFLWWDKPLDVAEPTIIRGPAALSSTALLLVLPENCRSVPCCIQVVNVDQYEDCWFHHRFNRQPIGVDIRFRVSRNKNTCSHEVSRAKELYNAEVPVSTGCTRVYIGERVHGFEIVATWLDGLDRRTMTNGSSSFTPVDLPTGILRRMEVANLAASQHRGRLLVENPVLVDRIQNHMTQEDDKSFWQFLTGLTLASLIYGGLHLTAWNAPMSDSASLLWRISSIFVLVFGPALAISIVFQKWRESAFSWDSNQRIGLLEKIPLFSLYYLSLFARLCNYGVLSMYVIARIFLVVECFINIRHLPASTFEVPQWSQYFPHIS